MPQRIIALSTFDRGTYLHTGFSRSSNEAYFLRWNDLEAPRDQVRAFFAFDFSQVQLKEDERITGIALSLLLPTDGFLSPNDRERISIHVAPQELTDFILHGGQQPQILFATLGAGDPISEAFVLRTQENSSVLLPINDRGRQLMADSLAASDKRLILGACLRPWGPRAANRRLFMKTLALPAEATNLEIDVESL